MTTTHPSSAPLLAQPAGTTVPGAPEVAAGALDMPPREFVEWMEQEAAASDLWWQLKERGELGNRHQLDGVGRIADLVHHAVEPRDHLTLEDDDPVTRYAQALQLGGGLFLVEISKRFDDGAYNWRIGRGRAGEDAENVPGGLVTGVQELTAVETIEVLTSWAQGHGLPLGYGASLHMCGGVVYPVEVG